MDLSQPRRPTASPQAAGPLRRLLCPRSIAFIGRAACAQAIRQCRQIGFEGEIWPIHLSLLKLEGLNVYSSVAALPAPPDAAFVAVNCHTTIEVMRSLAERRAGGAVCYASGFAEAGVAGRELQAQLIQAAGDMPFFGPNCHGFLNYLDGVALWPEQHGGVRHTRGVALVTQSGNIALNLTMQTRALPLGYVVTLGNQANITLAHALEALLDDGRVTAIGLHIEGIGDPAHFFRAATIARERRVPLIALQSGRSELGASLAVSHTASLAGADEVASVFLSRCGVARVHSLPALLETLKLLHVHGPLNGRNIASLSSSGGEAALIADSAAAWNLHFRPFTPTQAQHITRTLPALATATNPLDYHNFNWGDEVALRGIYAAVMQASFDLTLLILDFPRSDRCSPLGFESAVRALCAASSSAGARAAVVSTLQETFPEDRARELLGAGVAPLCGLDDALAAIDAATRVHELWQSPVAFTAPSLPAEGSGHSLSEWESKRLLARHGLRIPRGEKVNTVQGAVAAADAIGYPVALKSVGPSIAHKTEIGGVQLNLHDAHNVRAAAAQQLAALGAELLVEEMITDAVAELIIGIGRDRVFGLYLLIGAGGVLAELIAERCILLLPASPSEIRAAIASLKVGKMLCGYRGGDPGDEEAAVAAALTIQQFAIEQREWLLELDVNPLLVRARGHGAVAVDAMIRIAGVRKS
jgi:acyl-CoA synthetase (NDP forming)